MSLLKIIIIVIATGVVLFILLLTYTLWPTVRNVSDNKALNPFLNKSLTLKRKAFLHLAEKPESTFLNYILNERDDFPGIAIAELPEGTIIRVSEFKTYKNSVSGFMHLYAIGKLATPSHGTIEFENEMGGTDPSLYSTESGVDLGLALWQDSTDIPIRYEK